MYKFIITTLILTPLFCFSQNINIPDAAFKSLLVNYSPVIDLNQDGQISIAEAQGFTDTLTNSGFQGGTIFDITGLEEFINIRGFAFGNTGLTYIDLTANTALEYVNLGDNFILDSNIDMSVHANLTFFSIENTQVKKVNLDNGNNTNMTFVDVYPANCVTVDDINYASSAPNWVENNISVYTTTPCFVGNTTGVENIENDYKLNVYPNPFINNIRIESAKEISRIKIINYLGKTVVDETFVQNALGTNTLNSGIYFLQIHYKDSQVKTLKIQKL